MASLLVPKRYSYLALVLLICLAGFSIAAYRYHRHFMESPRLLRSSTVYRTLFRVTNELDFFRSVLKRNLSETLRIDLLWALDDVKANNERVRAFLEVGYIKKTLNPWRNAKVIVDGKPVRVKYKIHGVSVTPLRRGAFSIKIAHKDAEPYLGHVRKYNLITEKDTNPLTISVNRIAAAFDLLAPHGRMVQLRINSVNHGAYHLVEDHRKEWFEREHGITNYTMIAANDDWDRQFLPHLTPFDLEPGNMEVDGTAARPDIALARFDQLAKAVISSDIAQLKSLIDVDYMARFMAVATLFNSNHFATGDNTRYIYDFTQGRFVLIFRFEDLEMPSIMHPAVYDFNKNWFAYCRSEHETANISQRLYRVLLSDPEFLASRNEYLYQLLKSKDAILRTMQSVIDENRAVVLHGSQSRLEFYLQTKRTFARLHQMFELLEAYLSYSKVYVTNLTKSGSDGIRLKVVCDSHVPLLLKEVEYDVAASSKEFIHPVNETMPALRLNRDLDVVPTEVYVTVPNGGGPIKNLIFVNSVTGEAVDQEDVYLTKLADLSTDLHARGTAALDRQGIKYRIEKSSLIIGPGDFMVSDTIILPEGLDVVLAPATTLRLGEGVSFLVHSSFSAQGTKHSPIRIVASDARRPFGVLGVVGRQDSKVVFDHVFVQGGSEALVDGVDLTGMLSIYHAAADIRNSRMSHSASDDGLNVKNGHVNITDSTFELNKVDQIDLDFCTGRIDNNTFGAGTKDANGDGLDLSGSSVAVTNNRFIGFSDKGVSVGERSIARMRSNVFEDNRLAMAVKDGSQVWSLDDAFQQNQIDISLFVKKKIFPDPILYLDEKASAKVDVQKGKVQKPDPRSLLTGVFKETLEYAP